MNQRTQLQSQETGIQAGKTNSNTATAIMDRVSIAIARCTYPNLITYANGLQKIFGDGRTQNKQTEKDYINLVIMPIVGLEVLPTICINDTSFIIEQFKAIVDRQLLGSIDKKFLLPK